MKGRKLRNVSGLLARHLMVTDIDTRLMDEFGKTIADLTEGPEEAGVGTSPRHQDCLNWNLNSNCCARLVQLFVDKHAPCHGLTRKAFVDCELSTCPTPISVALFTFGCAVTSISAKGTLDD